MGKRGHEMSRYIDADALLKNLPEDLPYKASVKRALIQAPDADVVEVVRCKDCKYFTIDEGDALGYCTCQKIPMNFVGELYPEEYFYCFYGERSAKNEG
jgi:hypothetical protein